MKKHTKKILFVLVFLISAVTAFAQNWKNEISSDYFYIQTTSGDSFVCLEGEHPANAKRDVQFMFRAGLQYAGGKYDYSSSFIFVKINGTENYAIKNKAGFFMDIEGKDKLNLKEKIALKAGKKIKMKKDEGAKIQTWTNDKGVPSYRQWRLIMVDKNSVMIENVFTKKLLTMSSDFYLVSSKRSTDKRKQIFRLMYAKTGKESKLLSFD